jgi:glycosyltransferase involved in cell wall biosynthesis
MKKILIDGRLLADQPTGISRYTKEIIQALSEKYGRENIRILVSTEFNHLKEYQTLVTKLKPYNPLHFILFSLYVNKLDFSIYYSTYYSGLYFTGRKRKQIVTVHDLMYLRIENYFSASKVLNWFYKKIFSFIVRLSLHASDLTISVSKTTQNDLFKYFRKNSIVIGEGVNYFEEKQANPASAEKFAPSDIILKRLQIEKEKYFLYVGNFRKQKNTSFLIEAFVSSNSPHKLLLVGNSQFMQHKNENVIFGGIPEDNEIQCLYQNCLAFILPSLYEGFGLAILEAYCNGARVFSSNRGALSEFNDLKISYFSPFNQHELINLIQNAENIAKQSESEIEAVKKIYSWKRQTDRIIETIESFIS